MNTDLESGPEVWHPDDDFDMPGKTSPAVSKVVPLVVSRHTMEFPEAMRAVIDGRKVTRLEWNDTEIWVALFQDKLILHKAGVYYPLTVSSGDMLGEDWVVIEE